MKWYLFSILVIFCNLSSAQIFDDFSDGDFSSNPVWIGDTSFFEVNSSQQLRLLNNTTDTSAIATASSQAVNCEWSFWTKLSLNTTSGNFARFYLTSNNPNLKDTLTGYYVQLGGTNDSVSICYQKGLSSTMFLKSKLLYTGSSSNSLRIRITRSTEGVWTLYSDPEGSYFFQKEDSALENSFMKSSYSGVYCRYTMSNARNFYFDDIYVGNMSIDTTRPAVTSAQILNDSTIKISFSERITNSSAISSINYDCTSAGTLTKVIYDSIDLNNVVLIFNKRFISGNNYSIRIKNIIDASGNILKDTTIHFQFYLTNVNDIVISEIMADPDPPIGLPNYEYLELLNVSPMPVNLKNWSLTLGSGVRVLPDFELLPGAYLIVCHEDGKQYFTQYGNVIGLSSFQLTNTGTAIYLKDANSRVINYVKYSDDWYHDISKDNGGWSLELVDPNNLCGVFSNWRASVSVKGGTPGSVNSVYSTNSDSQGPSLVRASIFDYFTVQVHFSEPIDTNLLLNPAYYLIDNGVGNPVEVSAFNEDHTSALLSFPSIIQFNTIYTVRVSDSIHDCKGNYLEGSRSARFAIPIPSDSNDLIINEILFNPKLNGVDYVELYNRSEKVIDLAEMKLCSFDSLTGVFKDLSPVSDGYLIFPGEYVTLSIDPKMVSSQYPNVDNTINLMVDALPAFNNDAGNVSLINSSSQVIDAFTYHEKMHFALLNSFEGVSLERVNPERASNDPGNWHSASESSGFGTPTLKNSQYFQSSSSEASLSLEPKLFSPDNDGRDDYLTLSLTFNSQGFTTSIDVYDSDGRLVRRLARNKLCGAREILTWDGLNESGEKCNIGTYILYVESYNPAGTVSKNKAIVILGGKI